MKIENEFSYYEKANLKEGKKLAKKYMKKAISEVPKVIGNGELPTTRKFVAQDLRKFFHKRYIEAVYLYQNNGGWYGDILCKRGDETEVIGTPNSKPYGSRQEAIDYIIRGMAKIIAVGNGKIKLVDKSGVPEGYIDFRLYTDTLVMPVSNVGVLTTAIESVRLDRGCEINDIIEESKITIHDEMSKPAWSRNNLTIYDRILALIGCDVNFVNYPIGWDGDPFEIPVKN